MHAPNDVRSDTLSATAAARDARQASVAKLSAATDRRRVRALLAAGAVLGFSLAVAVIVEPRAAARVPRDAVATVNGVAISVESFERATTALDSDRRAPLNESDRRAVLDRLIDEELLVQRARALGLDRHDRGVRSRLIAAMVEAVLADEATTRVSDAEVAAFYDANAGYFSGEDRVRVRRLRVSVTAERSDAEALATAWSAAERLRAGADFATVASDLADAAAVPVPDSLLPAAKLRDYLGPTLAARALGLQGGEVGDPLRDGAGFSVLQVVARAAGVAPPLGQIEEDVRAEMRRRADDRAFRAYLDRLRAEATVHSREP